MWKSACPCSHSIHSFSTSANFASVKAFLDASATNHGRKLESEARLAKHSRNICRNVGKFLLWKSSAIVRKLLPNSFPVDAFSRLLCIEAFEFVYARGITADDQAIFFHNDGVGIEPRVARRVQAIHGAAVAFFVEPQQRAAHGHPDFARHFVHAHRG